MAGELLGHCSDPLLTLIALVAQKVWYFAPELSRSARILPWLAAAVLRSASATAVPRFDQSLMALALLRSARSLNRIQ